VKLFKNIVVLSFILIGLIGCSSDKDIIPPAKLVDFKSNIKLKKIWSKSVGSGQGKLWNNLQITTDGKYIFSASFNGKVYALDKTTGKKIWQTKLKHKNITGGTGYGANLVILGTLKGDVIALDANSGTIKWQAKVGSEILAPPAANDEIVVVQSQNDTLTAFKVSDGSKLWELENQTAVLSLRGTSSPIVNRLLVLAGLSSGKVIAVNAQTGTVVWEQKIAVGSGRTELDRMIDIDGNLYLSGNSLYAVSFQGKLASFDLDSGTILWSRDASSYAGVTEQMGTVVVTHANSTVESFDENLQQVNWHSNLLLMRELSAPTIMNDYVIFGDFAGYLHVLNLEDGQMIARTKIDGKGVRAKILVVDDLIYAFANNGKLVALKLVNVK